jgi:DnaJ-class molecular chaperone
MARKRSRTWDDDYAPYGSSNTKGTPEDWRGAYQERMMGHDEAIAVLDKDNPYTILGLKQGASKDEVKKAYRNLAKKHHPDVGGDAEVFKKILAAYSLLGGK